MLAPDQFFKTAQATRAAVVPTGGPERLKRGFFCLLAEPLALLRPMRGPTAKGVNCGEHGPRRELVAEPHR